MIVFDLHLIFSMTSCCCQKRYVCDPCYCCQQDTYWRNNGVVDHVLFCCRKNIWRIVHFLLNNCLLLNYNVFVKVVPIIILLIICNSIFLSVFRWSRIELVEFLWEWYFFLISTSNNELQTKINCILFCTSQFNVLQFKIVTYVNKRCVF